MLQIGIVDAVVYQFVFETMILYNVAFSRQTLASTVGALGQKTTMLPNIPAHAHTQ